MIGDEEALAQGVQTGRGQTCTQNRLRHQEDLQQQVAVELHVRQQSHHFQCIVLEVVGLVDDQQQPAVGLDFAQQVFLQRAQQLRRVGVGRHVQPQGGKDLQQQRMAVGTRRGDGEDLDAGVRQAAADVLHQHGLAAARGSGQQHQPLTLIQPVLQRVDCALDGLAVEEEAQVRIQSERLGLQSEK